MGVLFVSPLLQFGSFGARHFEKKKGLAVVRRRTDRKPPHTSYRSPSTLSPPRLVPYHRCQPCRKLSLWRWVLEAIVLLQCACCGTIPMRHEMNANEWPSPDCGGLWMPWSHLSGLLVPSILLPWWLADIRGTAWACGAPTLAAARPHWLCT